MSERDELAEVIGAEVWRIHGPDSTDEESAGMDGEDIADAILASDWLARHDAQVRAEVLREVMRPFLDSRMSGRDLSDDGSRLEGRYYVKKLRDPDGKHDACRYFVLDPQHDPIARYALRAYATAAGGAGLFGLRRDLHQWVDDVETAEREAAS
jgi:hypothetical protein